MDVSESGGQNGLKVTLETEVETGSASETTVDHLGLSAAEEGPGADPPACPATPDPDPDLTSVAAGGKEEDSSQGQGVGAVGGMGAGAENAALQHLFIRKSFRPFKCTHCGKAFRDKERLEQHVRAHHGRDAFAFACHLCARSFATDGALEDHLLLLHMVKRSYACLLCSDAFEKLELLKEHVGVHAGPDGCFTCPSCSKSFSDFIQAFCRPDKLRLHMLRHSDRKDFLCSTCGKQFKRKDKLREHMQRMHNPDREAKKADRVHRSKALKMKAPTTDLESFMFKCRVCMMGFRRRGMLVNHLSKRHPEMRIDDVPELTLPIIKPNRDYLCQYCDKVYKSASKRKAHILKNHPGSELPPSIRNARASSNSLSTARGLFHHLEEKRRAATMPAADSFGRDRFPLTSDLACSCHIKEGREASLAYLRLTLRTRRVFPQTFSNRGVAEDAGDAQDPHPGGPRRHRDGLGVVHPAVPVHRDLPTHRRRRWTGTTMSTTACDLCGLFLEVRDPPGGPSLQTEDTASRGDPERGDPERGDPERGHPERGHPKRGGQPTDAQAEVQRLGDAGYVWLADVRSFTDQWGGATASSSSSLEALRGGAISAYDQLIGDVRRWSDRIRRAPPSFAAAATGRLFLVDASGLLEKLAGRGVEAELGECGVPAEEHPVGLRSFTLYATMQRGKAHSEEPPGLAEASPSIRKLRPAAPGEPDPMLSTHTQLTGTIASAPVCCPHCAKQYSSKTKMVQHIRKKHAEFGQLTVQTPLTAAAVISSSPATTDLLTQAMTELSQTLNTDYRTSPGDYQRIQYIPVAQAAAGSLAQPQHIQLQVVQVAPVSSPHSQNATVDVSQLHEQHGYSQHSIQVQQIQVSEPAGTAQNTSQVTGQPLSPASSQQTGQEMSPGQLTPVTLTQSPVTPQQGTVQHAYIPSNWNYRGYPSEIQMMALPHTQYVIAEASAPTSAANGSQVKTTHYVISDGQSELEPKQVSQVSQTPPPGHIDHAPEQEQQQQQQQQQQPANQQPNTQYIITTTTNGGGVTSEVHIAKP
ncbi:LOW QUALITY PROTEIN: hypothetical protein CRUP_035731 [Coryphaenoides rupestris]|nr:LOW QUALITY PROTEIN: hypothetical protein CRUP_035731 [Coryphaenoides rupestris]